LPKKRENKEILGMPMSWDRKNILNFKALWNEEDDELFPPKTFGIGWTINFHALLRAMGLIRRKNLRK
jgi:hypothetical protein